MSSESAEEYTIVEKNGKWYQVYPPKIPADTDDPNAEIDLGAEIEICRVPYPHPTTMDQKTINDLTIQIHKQKEINHWLNMNYLDSGEEIRKFRKKIDRYEQKQKDLAGYIKDLQKRTEELLEYAKKLEDEAERS